MSVKPLTTIVSRRSTEEVTVWFALTTLIFVALGVSPRADRLTWFLESLPVILFYVTLMATRRRFPLTPLAYRLLFIGGILLMIGAHYTFAGVPLSRWTQKAFALDRSNYDRVGHVMQGFILAVVWREIYVRLTPLDHHRVVSLVVVLSCLATAAFYELCEWWVALMLRGRADAFLAVQNDPWDAHWDMLCATIGALLSLSLLTRLHDRELTRV